MPSLLFTIPTGAANMPLRESRNTNTGKQIWMSTKAELSPGNLFWGSFTNHNNGNYLRHGINITTNQRLSPTFWGNGNTSIIGDSQTSPLPIFPEGEGTSVHRLKKMSTAMLLKKQITSHYPWSILLKRLLKWHQNVQNFAAKPFTCSSTVDKSIHHGKLLMVC